MYIQCTGTWLEYWADSDINLHPQQSVYTDQGNTNPVYSLRRPLELLPERDPHKTVIEAQIHIYISKALFHCWMNNQSSGVILGGDCCQGKRSGRLVERKQPRSWPTENKTAFVEVSRALLGEKRPKRDHNKYRWDQLKGEQEALGT